MSDLEHSLINQKSYIAELNSVLLFDYEYSFRKYYNKENNSSFSLKFYKWFDYSNFSKTSNAFLKDFEEFFYNFVLKSSM